MEERVGKSMVRTGIKASVCARRGGAVPGCKSIRHSGGQRTELIDNFLGKVSQVFDEVLLVTMTRKLYFTPMNSPYYQRSYSR